MNSKVLPRQLMGWLLLGTIVPLLCLLGYNGWQATFFTALICGVITFWIIPCDLTNCPKWVSALELLWLPIFLGGIAAECSTCWDGQGKMIPLALLVLSAWGAQLGAQTASRAVAILCWLLLPLLAIVLLAGGENLDLQWIERELDQSDGRLTAVLLLPGLAAFIPGNGRKKATWMIPVIGGVTVLSALWLEATIGTDVVKAVRNGFYEYSKGITLFGVAERFEALVACALTGGWFALFAIVLSAANHLAQNLKNGWGRGSTWLCALVGVVLMCTLHISPEILGFGSLIFWGLLPLLTQGLGLQKKSGKSVK